MTALPAGPLFLYLGQNPSKCAVTGQNGTLYSKAGHDNIINIDGTQMHLQYLATEK